MPYSQIPELDALHEFDTAHRHYYYAQGFELYETFGNRDDLAPGWSDDDAFHARLKSFAQATAGGSIYALWQADDGARPVVVFGDEGGIHVVATGVRDLLRILTFDVEPMVDWDRAYYFKSDEDEPSDDHDAYVTWLRGTLGLEPVDDADRLVETAQHRHAASFKAWMEPFAQQM
ncbi:hypothetical protein KIH74_19985 [Kineosporia sp. J2-2]|uniref:SUKH-4 immunity protein of toxin-antitoxin system n=1 Tax=Kineosporia corallincola TaxID=2835133 RepID=A0ABS5TJG7_9ACTN|nr:hypothetical protein [Kineosporia corallincola]MBT0771230.1 hypothetical protein [Kineosporia corallincola]